jgi:predicted ester cyclase
MSPEENKAVIIKLYNDVLGRREFHLASQFLTPDFKRHDVGKLFPDRSGSGGAEEHMLMLHAAIPDLRVEVIDAFAGDDRVCVRYHAYGTHKGDLLGRPGTGNPVRWEGVIVYRMVDGKVAETWQYADALGFLRQIGATPLEPS